MSLRTKQNSASKVYVCEDHGKGKDYEKCKLTPFAKDTTDPFTVCDIWELLFLKLILFVQTKKKKVWREDSVARVSI